MDRIAVVCHKDHDKGYEDYAGKCLLCEVERLQNKEWVGLTDEERRQIVLDDPFDWIAAVEAKLKEKNT